jgi:predicted nucleic acid-binding protein
LEPNVKLYLDNCCFNRPFDDQAQTRVRLEAEAKLCVQGHVLTGRLELVWSYILDLENQANPFDERRRTIAKWSDHAQEDIEETDEIIATAARLSAVGLKPKDALHVACAIAAQCDYFLTTDDQILQRASNIQDIAVLDPLSLVRVLNL